MQFNIPKELYSKEVLFKTCYKFTEENYVHLSSDDSNFIISIESKDGSIYDNTEKKFKNELIEQVNRTLVFNETKNIREMLYARAMSSSMIYLSESEPGINTDVTDKSAMRDWFDEE